MPTKADLENKIGDLQKHIDGLIAERGIFYTKLLKLAFQTNNKDLINFLNPTQQEIISTKDDLEFNPDCYAVKLDKRLVWCVKCNGYLPLFGKQYKCPNCKDPISKTSIVNLHKKNGKKPKFDVYIGRYNKEIGGMSIWENPFYINDYKNPLDCLKDYKKHILERIKEFPLQYDLKRLRGKRLGCWCKPKPCHGDVLLELLGETNDTIKEKPKPKTKSIMRY